MVKSMKLQKMKKNFAEKISERAAEYAKQSVGKSLPMSFHEVPVPKELRQKEHE